MTEIYVGGVTYRRLYNTCGGKNKKCKKCAEGIGHGPYWFAFGLSFSRKYIGKNLPEEITAHLSMLETERARLMELEEHVGKRMNEHLREYQKAQREMHALAALRRGDQVDQNVLKDLGLEKFCLNGHK